MTGAPYVRLAKPSELESLVELERRAFIEDPAFNYFGSVHTALSNDIDSAGRRHLETFFKFFNRYCSAAGGRIMVVATPEGDKEKIVALTIWIPPGKGVVVTQAFELIGSGIFSVLRTWGLRTITRIGVVYEGACQNALKKAFKAKGLRESPSTAWYLILACTDPDAEGKGYMSMLLRDAFASAPSSIFTVEATTTKARDVYLHLGFELCTEFKQGKLKVDSKGLPARTPGEADGVSIYSMIKWE